MVAQNKHFIFKSPCTYISIIVTIAFPLKENLLIIIAFRFVHIYKYSTWAGRFSDEASVFH